MTNYEAMFILHNRDLGESEETPATPEELVTALVEKVGGSVHSTMLWANRKLAYPIKGNQTGTYVLAYISGEPGMTPLLNREVHLSDRCLRMMTLTIRDIPDEMPAPLAEPATRGGRTDDPVPGFEDGTKKKAWELLDYKNVYVLRRMVSAQGKLFSRQRSGLHAKSQRRLRREVHRARNLALLPFVAR